jgi:nucleotide sugar dehydrogenase
VVGLGTVGLPTALHVSNFFDAIGYDINQKAVEDALRFGLDSTFRKMPFADIYVVAVSTGINDDNSADMSSISNVFAKISDLNPEALVCVESTVTYGTCRRLAEEFTLKNIVHCPHRYWSGDTLNYGVVQTRVFGALSGECFETGRKFYEKLNVPLYGVSSIEVAEMSKVVENAYRFTQIAFAEEIKIICDNCGFSFEELRYACNTKWNINILEAKDGIGGHCLPKDIRYLWSIFKPPLLSGAIQADEAYKKHRE